MLYIRLKNHNNISSSFFSVDVIERLKTQPKQLRNNHRRQPQNTSTTRESEKIKNYGQTPQKHPITTYPRKSEKTSKQDDTKYIRPEIA